MPDVDLANMNGEEFQDNLPEFEQQTAQNPQTLSNMAKIDGDIEEFRRFCELYGEIGAERFNNDVSFEFNPEDYFLPQASKVMTNWYC